jgi:hypothetical protein
MSAVHRLMDWLEKPTDFVALTEGEARELMDRLDRAELCVHRFRSALESVAWGYTGGASAKTLGEIAGKALTEDERRLLI